MPVLTKSRAAHLGPERRRPAVLDAALAVAVEHGVSAVTVGSVADHLGVTRPVVYACFGDRVSLLEALVDREAALLLTTAVDALHSSHGPDAERVFVHGYSAFLTGVAERPDSWRLVFDADPDPAVAPRFRAARQEMSATAQNWIGPALTKWWATSDLEHKLPVLVELFVSSCEAAARSLLDPSNTWRPDELGELYGQAMCRAFSGA